MLKALKPELFIIQPYEDPVYFVVNSEVSVAGIGYLPTFQVLKTLRVCFHGDPFCYSQTFGVLAIWSFVLSSTLCYSSYFSFPGTISLYCSSYSPTRMLFPLSSTLRPP